jgi:peptide deformylase
MAVREIVTLPDPILRRKAHKVTRFDKDLQDFFDDMVETMRNEPGVGLAAPQVNVPNQIIVVEWGDDNDEEAPKKLYMLANPEIIQTSSEMVSGVEGCLSVPELVGEVERYQEVTVKGLNRFGKMVKIKASGWLARIFQHEIDHVNGIVFTDRATRVWVPKENEEILA